MNDNTKMSLATALASGYFLGRTRKARAAVVLASFLAGRRLALSPQELLGQGFRWLRGTPQFGALSDQVRQELLSAGRSAATSLASRRLGSLTDSLHERTRTLREGGQEGPGGGEDEEGEQERAAPADEDEAAPRQRQGGTARSGAEAGRRTGKQASAKARGQRGSDGSATRRADARSAARTAKSARPRSGRER